MAKAILTVRPAHFMAYSVGSHPSGLVRAEALKQSNFPARRRMAFAQELERILRSLMRREWISFLTVCDNAASEVCPVWPGQPMTAHWGVPTPPQ